MHKKIATTVGTLLVSISLFMPATAFAMTTTGVKVASASGALRKTAADQEISRRVTALNGVLTRLGQLKHLSDTDKTTLTSGIQGQITSLTALETKINADTDPATLKADKQSIVTSYRIFLVYIPQVRILAAADSMEDAVTILQNMATKISTRLQQAQSAGNNVTALQADLTNMQTALTNAQTEYQNAESTVAGLTPAGYPGNKAQLVAGRQDIQTGRTDLQTSLKDAQTIVAGLKSMKSASASASTSASSSAAK